MRKFLDSIETALTAAKIDCSGIGIEAGAVELFAVRSRVSATYRVFERLEFKPVIRKPHHFLVEEIWWTKTDDGRWSDNMGGVIIDCTGLSREAAVKEIVNKVTGRFPQWFEK